MHVCMILHMYSNGLQNGRLVEKPAMYGMTEPPIVWFGHLNLFETLFDLPWQYWNVLLGV